MTECPLKGLIITPKNTTKTNKATLKSKNILVFGLIPKSKKTSIDRNTPTVKNEAFLRVNNNFSFKIPIYLSK